MGRGEAEGGEQSVAQALVGQAGEVFIVREARPLGVLLKLRLVVRYRHVLDSGLRPTTRTVRHAYQLHAPAIPLLRCTLTGVLLCVERVLLGIPWMYI